MTRRLRELVLWAGAACGLLALVAGVAVTWFGFSFLVFRSGSMSPEIDTGALALARTVPAADLARGDVVSVIAADGNRITHRVVTSTLRGEQTSLVLQGDANAAPDAEVYVVRSAERVSWSVPYAGYVVAHVLTPPGLLAAACLSGILLVLGFGEARPGTRPERPREPRVPRRPVRRWVSGRRGGSVLLSTVLATAALAGGGLVASRSVGTLASFTDRATATSGAFSAATLGAPSGGRCSESGGTYARWTAPTTGPAPTGYLITYTTDRGDQGTVELDANDLLWRPKGSGILNTTTYTYTVAARYGSTWTGPTTAADQIRIAVVLFYHSWSCP